MPSKKSAGFVPVKVIKRNGQALLVEWNDGAEVRRGVVPGKAVVDDRGKLVADRDDLRAAITYGVPWESLLPRVVLQVRSADVAKAFAAYGVWTEEDYFQKPAAVKAAIASLIGPIYDANLAAIKAARKLVSPAEKEGQNG